MGNFGRMQRCGVQCNKGIVEPRSFAVSKH